ncbi:hypothetical protein [Emticicia sp. TH156]|uniref:hypothetical protein n=1 Tax=Emticicia sp. TH156 TaxID=2067454 RepID=UPI000C762035|nr:hypothetical protein [Emticicia sp. TH156]PLK42765.1 hypothetical protein C0V77_19745 [Emticicia sp. TH156]
MSVSNIFFSLWRKVSMPFLAITLIVCYFTFPDDVAVHHTSSGRPDDFISKQDFFYIAFGTIIVFNFLLNLLKSQVLRLNFAQLNQKSLWAKNTDALRQLLTTWFDVFIAVINTYMIFFLLALNRVNRSEDQKLDINYDWFVLAGAVILLVVIFYLPVKLLYTNPETKE